ncbi:MAG: hypothetical protein ACRDJE_04740 [Dehalococcoidia bacterium]
MSTGYTVVTWIGRGALCLWALLVVAGLYGAASGSAVTLLGTLLWSALLAGVAGGCAVIRGRMLERRLAQFLMSDGNDTRKQVHPLPWKR